MFVWRKFHWMSRRLFIVLILKFKRPFPPSPFACLPLHFMVIRKQIQESLPSYACSQSNLIPTHMVVCKQIEWHVSSDDCFWTMNNKHKCDVCLASGSGVTWNAAENYWHAGFERRKDFLEQKHFNGELKRWQKLLHKKQLTFSIHIKPSAFELLLSHNFSLFLTAMPRKLFQRFN